MKKLYLLLLLFVSVIANAQDIKPLDYASHYKKHKVTSRDCFEVKYKGNQALDSIHRGFEEYDQHGRLIKFTEYYAKGKEMAIYRYEYDDKAKIIKNTVSIVFNNWQAIELTLTHDAKGRLIQREMPELISNFWCKETFSYGKGGTLTKSDQWYMSEGSPRALSHKEYDDQIEWKENTPTHIFDSKGLLIIQQTCMHGRCDSAYCYSYSYF